MALTEVTTRLLRRLYAAAFVPFSFCLHQHNAALIALCLIEEHFFAIR